MEQFPIRVLSEKTGVAPTTLRAWERRYGLLKPQRTPKGHRLYTALDVGKVMQVVALLEKNYTISKAINAIRLQEARQQASPYPDITGDESETSPQNHWETFIARFLKAIAQFDENRLEAVYNEALSLYPIDIVTTNLLRPLLSHLGGQWDEHDTGIAEEHFFSAFLRNKVGARMHHAGNRNQGSRLILACLPDEQHELGALLFGLSAMSRGYRILFLGANLPLDQIIPVLNKTRIDTVVLSGSMSSLSDGLAEELNTLVSNCPAPVMLGGKLSEVLMAAGEHPTLDNQIVMLGNDYARALSLLETRVPANRYPQA